jgi:hypothetical protein
MRRATILQLRNTLIAPWSVLLVALTAVAMYALYLGFAMLIGQEPL